MSQPSIREVAMALAYDRGLPLDQAQAIAMARLHALDDAPDHDSAGSPSTLDDDAGGGDDGGGDDVAARALASARAQLRIEADAAAARAKAAAERPEAKCLAAIRTLAEHLPKISDLRAVFVHLDDEELGGAEGMCDRLSDAMADHAQERSAHPLSAHPVGGRRAAA
jgi:hypothetical protein